MNEFFKKPIVKILMLKGEKGDKGETGTGTPTGGKTGQYLQKKTDADYDYRWSDITTVPWDDVTGKTNATTSSAGLMSVEDKSKLDNLQVGGRNLLTNSKGEFSFGYPADEKTPNYGMQQEVPLPNDATHFVLSFDAKSTVDGDGVFSFFYNPANVSKTEVSSVSRQTANNSKDGRVTTLLTTEWKRYWIKWTAPVADTRTVLPMRLDAGQGTGKVSMRNVKFEVGTVPTDWTPAPEDVDSKIDGVDSKIDALNSVTKNFTLSAASWSDWTQSISDSLITATSNQEVIPAIGISKEQLIAFQKAMVVDAGQEVGKLTLRVMGTLPTINIPIRVIFRGKI